MAAQPTDPAERFLDRIERRVKTLQTLAEAGLGVYLPSDEDKRKRAIEQAVRLTARQSELPHLTPEILERAYTVMRTHLEAGQRALPHDVQYRNRIRQTW